MGTPGPGSGRVRAGTARTPAGTRGGLRLPDPAPAVGPLLSLPRTGPGHARGRPAPGSVQRCPRRPRRVRGRGPRRPRRQRAGLSHPLRRSGRAHAAAGLQARAQPPGDRASRAVDRGGGRLQRALVLRPPRAAGAARGGAWGLAARSPRPLRPGQAGGRGSRARARGRPGGPPAPRVLRPDRAAAHPGGARRLPRGPRPRRLRACRGPALGLPGPRRTSGRGLVGRGALRRHLRLPGRRRHGRVALARLGPGGLRRQPALRRLRDPPAGRRPPPGRHADDAPGHRLQPAAPADQRGRQHRGGIPAGLRGRPRRDHGRRVPGADRGLCPLPRPQVRPDPPARLLRPVGPVRRHRRVRPVLPLHPLDADTGPGPGHAPAGGAPGRARARHRGGRGRGRERDPSRARLPAPGTLRLRRAGPHGQRRGRGRLPVDRRARAHRRRPWTRSLAVRRERGDLPRDRGLPAQRPLQSGPVGEPARLRASRGDPPHQVLDRFGQPRLPAPGRGGAPDRGPGALLAGGRHRDPDPWSGAHRALAARGLHLRRVQPRRWAEAVPGRRAPGDPGPARPPDAHHPGRGHRAPDPGQPLPRPRPAGGPCRRGDGVGSRARPRRGRGTVGDGRCRPPPLRSPGPTRRASACAPCGPSATPCGMACDRS